MAFSLLKIIFSTSIPSGGTMKDQFGNLRKESSIYPKNINLASQNKLAWAAPTLRIFEAEETSGKDFSATREYTQTAPGARRGIS